MNRPSFLVFLFFIHLCLTVFFCFADEYSQEKNLLLHYRNSGDYLNESNLRRVLEQKLSVEDDLLNRTALKRILYLEQIELPGNVFFDTQISALSSNGDDLWIGSRSGDIARYSLSEKSWTSYMIGQESLAIRTVQTILPQGEQIWILSYGAVSVYSKRYNRMLHLNIPDDQDYRGLQSGIVLGSGLIAGTQSLGLRRIRLDGQSIIAGTSSLRNITFLQRLDDQHILAGSEENGLFMLDRNFTVTKAGRNSRQLSGVRTVLGNYREQMIAGSYGGGLYKLVRDGDEYDIVLLNSHSRWITAGVELAQYYCFSTLGEGLLIMNKDSMEISYFGISEGLGGLDLSSITYIAPYLICAVQGQGLVKIHEDIFTTP